MKRQNLKYVLSSFLLAVPFAASADMVWPSLYIVGQYYSWYVILAGLLVETITAHIFLKTSWIKSFGIMLVINAISALVGLLLIPLSGILVEFLTIPFGGGTFQLSHWILDYLCVILANTCIEGLALKLIFKYHFKTNFWWLLGANAISVIICVIVPMC